MENNQEWIAQTLDEILNNKSDTKLSGNTWVYECSCSPLLELPVLRMALLIFKGPFEEQIKNAIINSKIKNFEQTEIPGMVQQYWRKFMSALKLPSTREMAVEIQVADEKVEYRPWDAALACLEQLGIDVQHFERAMEEEISKPEHRELLRLLVSTSYLSSSGEVTDQALHNTYKALVCRLRELRRRFKRIEGFGPILEAEGYKLDEALVIDSIKVALGCDEQEIREFFEIKGNTLPRILTEVLIRLGPGEPDE